MADVIRHARSVSPWAIPNKGGSADDLHGVSNLSGGASVDSEDVYVVGKTGKCGTDTDIPESTISLTQYERGLIDTLLLFANLGSEPSGGLDLDDFNSSLTDIALYEREEAGGNVEQTTWFPKLAVDSIGLDIADPDARIERSIDLSGDNEKELRGNNKYLIHKQDTAGSGVSGNHDIDVSDPLPVVDPNNSGQYMLRVDRTRSGVTTTLTLTTDYTYDGAGTLTILSALADDVYDVYYSASSWGTGGDITSVDSASPCFLKAENVTVELSDGVTTVELDKLTSLSITATLNRIDESVIGNDERVLKEVQDKTVDVSLSGRVKDSTIKQVFMGTAGDTNSITDVNEFLSNAKLTVKIYSDATKSSFLIGYQVDQLAFSDSTKDFTANDFGTLDVSASSDNLLVSTNISNL